MDTLLPTLLGAFLAILGGIIGSLFTFHLTKNSELRNNKKDAYFKLLLCCETAATVEAVKRDEYLNKLAEAKTYVMLYGNADAKREFNTFHQIILKEFDNPRYEILLRSQTEMLSLAMKSDLGIADRNEKKLVKKHNREVPHNAD